MKAKRTLFLLQREMRLAHLRGSWDLVIWLVPKARKLRLYLKKLKENKCL